ncbi:MAG: hypothetical protein RLZ12_611, partial [Bacillota bacterium]
MEVILKNFETMRYAIFDSCWSSPVCAFLEKNPIFIEYYGPKAIFHTEYMQPTEMKNFFNSLSQLKLMIIISRASLVSTFKPILERLLEKNPTCHIILICQLFSKAYFPFHFLSDQGWSDTNIKLNKNNNISIDEQKALYVKSFNDQNLVAP